MSLPTMNIEKLHTILQSKKERFATVYPEAFERNAYLIEEAKPGGILIMDEIGPMESKSPRFCAAFLAALDGNVPILASVRDNDTPFLEQVRSHPNVRCFYLAEESKKMVTNVLGCLTMELDIIKSK